MVGGFTDFAHLRLRDHRPGNGDYELPPIIGPHSDSSKRSILRKYPTPRTQSTGVAPGDYPIPSTVGVGRSTRFGPPLEMDEKGNPIFPERGSSARGKEDAGDDGDRRPVELWPLPKQLSMAQCPDTPAYSIYGKLETHWEKSGTGAVGPGEYEVPSTFDRRGWGVPEGAHFGIRPDSAKEKEMRNIPGPGTYNVKRFGDDVPGPHEPLIAMRRPRKPLVTPGPGAYEDPTSIAARIAAPRTRMCHASTFAGRGNQRPSRAVAPGPGAYSVTTPSALRLLTRRQRHAPRFVRPAGHGKKNEKLRRKAAEYGYTLPSDFDFNYKKGKSLIGRWHDGAPRAEAVGPGSYDLSAAVPPPSGGRFTAGPFDQYAHLRAAAEKEARGGEASGSGLGPAFYNPTYSQVDSHMRSAIVGSGMDLRSDDNGVPGPGHYNPSYAIKDPERGGTVFYKGSFSIEENDTLGVGPGAHYNDYTAYSQSIAGDCASGAGFTMRVRYPARATHQVCKPYDETTNMNCTYADERTWESKVILPPMRK